MSASDGTSTPSWTPAPGPPPDPSFPTTSFAAAVDSLERADARGAGLAPVSTRERIVILDVLRGIALLGVAVANVWLWFSGIFFLFPAYHAEVTRLSLDAVVFNGIALVVSGKAATTFAFLFGLGFALQMGIGGPVPSGTGPQDVGPASTRS